ncbi:MAG: hypothetical protein KGL68_01360 [Burkholderiales bacterium]|nr:hypothetical protein [Burkholderiales bacterium]
MRSASKSLLALCAGLSVVLGGCGGGGSSGTATTPTTSTPPAASAVAQLTGTAATGAALANSPVTITNAAGNSPCVETSVTTSALGSYSCTLKAGETAPFFIVVTDPTGDKPPLVSVSTTTPPAGSALTLNVTPLTTAIVAQLVSPADALAVVNSRTVDATQLAAVTSNVVAQLQPVLGAIGVPAGYDPFTTSITAGTPDAAGNTADLVLDVVKVIADPATGQPAITTVDNPTPVLLATASGSGSTLAAPTAPLATLSEGTQLAALALKNCFALPTSTRALATDTSLTSQQGGPTVTAVAPECQDIVAQSTNGAGMDFLHNGYDAGQFFYNWLTSDSMTGASFSVPEVMAYYPGSTSATPGSFASLDRAILNFRFVDVNGNPGNAITMAARIPGTSTASRATDWWLTGNQQAVDTNVKMVIRRSEQLKSGANPASAFQAGVQFLINPIGPGSVQGGNSLQLARVTGPGLPAGGITYTVSSNASQTWMDLWNKTGSLTTGSACGNGTTTNCPIVWLEQTAGLTGTAATTLATNPTGFSWAQAGDGFDATQFVRPAQYQIELFYGTNTGTADLTVKKTLLSDFVRATQGAGLPWNTAGSQLLAALDPAGSLAGSQAALTIDWTQNIAAQQIGGATSMVNTASGSYGPQKGVPRGATSVTLDNQTVPAFTTTSTRAFLLNYRMLDGSNKSMVYRYK